MMKITNSLIFAGLPAFILLGCQDHKGTIPDAVADVSAQADVPGTELIPGRWYSEAQVEKGKALFLKNCASCHKADASGTKEWKVVDKNGNYPPPPLNGSAHTWHHSLDVLRRTIQRGGKALGGVMPGFSATLDKHETDQIIAYFQSTWPEDKYSAWLKMNN